MSTLQNSRHSLSPEITTTEDPTSSYSSFGTPSVAPGIISPHTEALIPPNPQLDNREISTTTTTTTDPTIDIRTAWRTFWPYDIKRRALWRVTRIIGKTTLPTSNGVRMHYLVEWEGCEQEWGEWLPRGAFTSALDMIDRGTVSNKDVRRMASLNIREWERLSTRFHEKRREREKEEMREKEEKSQNGAGDGEEGGVNVEGVEEYKDI